MRLVELFYLMPGSGSVSKSRIMKNEELEADKIILQCEKANIVQQQSVSLLQNACFGNKGSSPRLIGPGQSVKAAS